MHNPNAHERPVRPRRLSRSTCTMGLASHGGSLASALLRTQSGLQLKPAHLPSWHAAGLHHQRSALSTFRTAVDLSSLSTTASHSLHAAPSSLQPALCSLLLQPYSVEMVRTYHVVDCLISTLPCCHHAVTPFWRSRIDASARIHVLPHALAHHHLFRRSIRI